jgi:hypothetical protein
VPEQSICLAYVRNPPALHGLNLTSWLVLSLCDGRPEPDIARDYFAAVTPSAGAAGSNGALQSALTQLESLRLIRRAFDTSSQTEGQP